MTFSPLAFRQLSPGQLRLGWVLCLLAASAAARTTAASRHAREWVGLLRQGAFERAAERVVPGLEDQLGETALRNVCSSCRVGAR